MAGDRVGDLVYHLAMHVLLLGFVVPAIDSRSTPSPEGSSYEVIIPKPIVPWASETRNDEISYTIKASGTNYIVRLKRMANLMVKDFPVFTYDSEGQRIKSYPHIPGDCYCKGYVESIPNSWVALNTCSGLRGFLKIRDLYGIEPLQDSSTFQHFLYLIEETYPNGTGGRGGNIRKFFPYPFNLGIPIYIELFIVADNVMFHSESGNVSKVMDRVLDIVNLVNMYYSYLHVHVAPTGLEVWTETNPFRISSNIQDVLDKFNAWRKNSLDPALQYDTIHLFLYKRFGGDPGKTYLDAICKTEFSAGVDSHVTHNNYLFSKVVAHVLGHSIGLTNDDVSCVCDEENSCIMHLFHSRGSLFSNCSVEKYVAILESGRISCLINPPNVLLFSRRCGDGVVDPGEECDCGDAQKCGEDPCCNPNCSFKEGVLCTSGPCCHRCKFFAIGVLCRGKMNECDLPEFCNGESEWCPDDVYVQDGTPCNKTAYCYTKNCLTHDSLCTTIYGPGAQGAPKSCFQTLNTAGTLFGNCGDQGNGGPYVKCVEKNSMCGRAQCTGVRKLPEEWNFAEYLKTKVKDAECWSIGFPYGTGGDDVGVIPNGTHCGAEKICLSHVCVPLSSLNLQAECDATIKCHSKGVCNNLHNCHCNTGWAPPNCKYFGPGGSVDGGFPMQAWNTELMKLVFGIVIPMGLVLMALITGLLGKLNSWFRRWRY